MNKHDVDKVDKIDVLYTGRKSDPSHSVASASIIPFWTDATLEILKSAKIGLNNGNYVGANRAAKNKNGATDGGKVQSSNCCSWQVDGNTAVVYIYRARINVDGQRVQVRDHKSASGV
ncbi:unnamed protein product [Leptosia nina]|uniref:Uncharacterized protein n=1 Tax=Leptosia nina TaxID=320188 RepID=A0AAV1JR30_9NEOP